MQIFLKNRQTQAPSFQEILCLPVLADTYTDMGRVSSNPQNNMIVIIDSIDYSQIGSYSLGAHAYFVDDINQVYLGDVSVQNTIVGCHSDNDVRDMLTTQLITAAAGISVTVVPSDFSWPSVNKIFTRSFSNPSLAVNTSRQPSTIRDVMVNASVDVTTTLSLSGGSAGKVELKYADDSAFTTNVKTLQGYTNSNTGTLTIGLNTSQIGSASLTGLVPAGKYYRLVTTNVTGTPTYGTPVIQEVLL